MKTAKATSRQPIRCPYCPPDAPLFVPRNLRQVTCGRRTCVCANYYQKKKSKLKEYHAGRYRNLNSEIKAKYRERANARRREPEVKAKIQEYRRKPETKAKVKDQRNRPEVKAKQEEYARKYRQRPEVKSRNAELARLRRQMPEVKEYIRNYKQASEVKAKAREYARRHGRDPEVKAKRRERQRGSEAKAKVRVRKQQKLIASTVALIANVQDAVNQFLQENAK